MNRWYPIHLDMCGKPCIIVGGGHIAARRIRGLIEAGAKVTVISPQCHPDIHDLAAKGNLEIILRNYEGVEDLRHAHMVYAATDNEMTNNQVSVDAKVLQIPVNDIGDSRQSTFIVPAVLRRGRLIMSVSTSGASPGLAKIIRNELSEYYGREYEEYVDFLAELREWVHAAVANEQCRAMIFHHVLKFDIIELIQRGELQPLRSWLQSMLELELQVEQWDQRFKDYSKTL